MLKNYLKIALRNIWKNKVFSAINIVGLAVGMAACIVIMLFVFYERSFDRMHSGNIYRLNEVQTFDGMTSQNVALSMYPMGPTLKQEFSEVKSFVRINGTGKIPMFYKGKRVELAQSFLTDPDFFTMFDFPLEQGDRNHALTDPNSVVLTRKAATNLFLRKIAWNLLIDDRTTVSGVTEQRLEIPGSGQTVTVPLQIGLDLYQFFGDKGFDDLLNLALAIGGRSGSASRLKLTARIAAEIPGTNAVIEYPGDITIVDRAFSNP